MHSEERKRQWAGPTPVPPPFLLLGQPVAVFGTQGFCDFACRDKGDRAGPLCRWHNMILRESMITGPPASFPHCPVQQPQQKYYSLKFICSGTPDSGTPDSGAHLCFQFMQAPEKSLVFFRLHLLI